MVCRRVRIVQCLCWFQQSLFGDTVCGDISSRPCPSVYLLLRCLPILSESERFFFLIFCLKSSLGDFKKLTGFDFFVKILLALFCPVLAKNVPKTGFFRFFEKCYLWYLHRWHFSVKNWNLKSLESATAWKVSKYGVISGPYFSAFGLNAGKYGPKTTLYLDTFHTVRIRQSSTENGKMENCRFPNGHTFFELYFTLFRKVFKNFLRRQFYRKIHPDV